jgi:tetratricopeptide (TPR) repeat protein
MRHILKIVIAAMVLGLAQYSWATPDPDQQNAKTMTVAQLEAAGDAARAQKDYPQAIEYFKMAVQKDRKNAHLYNKLGLAELKNNETTAARLDFEKATKYNKRYSDALNNIGAVYYLQHDYVRAAKYFKKAAALEETRATFHVNLGAAWFGQKKMEQAVAEYSRALELDPNALTQTSKAGVAAQITSPEERAKYSYMMAQIYAKRGDVERCLECLKNAKDEGYHDIANVYKDEQFARMWQDGRLHQLVPPPEIPR